MMNSTIIYKKITLLIIILLGYYGFSQEKTVFPATELTSNIGTDNTALRFVTSQLVSDNLKYVNPMTYIALQTQQETGAIESWYTYTMELEITPLLADGQPDENNLYTTTLQVEHNTTTTIGGSFSNLSKYIIKEAYGAWVKIVSTTLKDKATNTPELINANVPTTIAMTIGFSGQQITRISAQSQPSIAPNPYDENNNELVISWNEIDGALSYDVEWTWLDSYDDNGGTLDPEKIALTEKSFKQNKTRIQTTALTYTIPLLYSKGFVIYRVRAVGRFFEAPERYKYSRWSSGINPKENVDDWSDFYEITTTKGHQNSKNWQFQASYAEEGKKKEVISYFDGSLRNRQTVTKINSDNNVIVGEVIYDAQGRPAIEVLPVPTANDTIGYYKDFNRNEQNAIYHYEDFDLDDRIAKDKSLTAGMSSEITGASKYYSSDNDITSAYKARIADADRMPFSQTEYTPDNTGRIQRKGGVGPDHQLGTKHEMRYAYGTPKQKELNRLFGYNVGNELHYKKNVVIDPNGQSSVSYIDPQGRTIATALAGGSPPQLTPLDDEADNTLHKKLSFNLLQNPEKNRPYSSNAYGPFIDGKLYTSQEVNAADNTDYFFDYILSTKEQNFTHECITDADEFKYSYDLEIAVIDDTGTSRLSNTIKTTVLAQNGPSYVLKDSILKLAAGSFGITKLLKVNKEALDSYAADYINKISNPENATCFIDPDGFAPEALIDGCFVSCEDCKQGLRRDANGVLQEPEIAQQNYVTAKMSTYEQFTDPDEEALLRARFYREWELLFLACDEPCRLDGVGTDPEILKNSLSCNIGVNKLLDDMRPTGQYGMQFTTDTEEDQNYDTLESLSIFKEDNLLFSANENSWRNPKHYEFDLTANTGHYYEEDGSISYVVIQKTGISSYDPPIVRNFDLELEPAEQEGYYKIEPQYLEIENIKDLKKYWKDSWAASLVTYHPEYSYLEYALATCVETNNVGGASMNSDGFDNAINAMETYAAAISISGGFNVLINNTTLVNNDPYFNNTIGLETNEMANVRKAIMEHALTTNYDNFNKNMVSVAYGNGTCSSVSACTGNFSVSDIANLSLESDRDRVWQTYRSYYLGLKQKIQHVFATIYANNAGYNNFCIGSSDVPVALAAILADYPQASQVNGFLSTPSETLCKSEGNNLYKTKEKRFQPADNLYNSGQDTADGVDELFIQANFDFLEETGACPLARDMLFFLDGLVKENTPSRNFISLRNNRTYAGQYLSRALFEELGGSFPEENLQISGTVNNNTIEISFPNGSPIQLFAVPGYSWSNYGTQWRFTEISELVYNDQYNATTKSFGFEILGRVVPISNPDNTFEEVVVIGSTLARIGECSINNSGNLIGQDLGDGSGGTLALNDCDIKPRFKAAMIHLINNLAKDDNLNDASFELGGYAPYFESYLPEYFEIPPSSSVLWRFQNGSYTLGTPSKVYMTYTPDEALPSGSDYIVTGFHIGRIINDTSGIYNIANLTYLDSGFEKISIKGSIIETGRTLLNFSCCGIVDVGGGPVQPPIFGEDEISIHIALRDNFMPLFNALVTNGDFFAAKVSMSSYPEYGNILKDLIANYLFSDFCDRDDYDCQKNELNNHELADFLNSVKVYWDGTSRSPTLTIYDDTDDRLFIQLELSNSTNSTAMNESLSEFLIGTDLGGRGSFNLSYIENGDFDNPKSVWFILKNRVRYKNGIPGSSGTTRSSNGVGDIPNCYSYTEEPVNSISCNEGETDFKKQFSENLKDLFNALLASGDFYNSGVQLSNYSEYNAFLQNFFKENSATHCLSYNCGFADYTDLSQVTWNFQDIHSGRIRITYANQYEFRIIISGSSGFIGTQNIETIGFGSFNNTGISTIFTVNNTDGLTRTIGGVFAQQNTIIGTQGSVALYFDCDLGQQVGDISDEGSSPLARQSTTTPAAKSANLGEEGDVNFPLAETNQAVGSCVPCIPKPDMPVSCTEKYELLQNTVAEIANYDLPEFYTPSYFCDLKLARATDDYIDYLEKLDVKEIGSLEFVTIAQFASTDLHYGQPSATTVIDAYANEVSAQGDNALGWTEFASNYIQSNPLPCERPTIIPTPNLPVEIPNEESDCEEFTRNVREAYSADSYASFLDAKRLAFKKAYIKAALSSAEETFTMEYFDKEYQYTLYYYDQAGNLKQTVPPEGVERFTEEQLTDLGIDADIDAHRLSNDGIEDKKLLPKHRLATEYKYNSLNQLVWQRTPDGGITRFAYDNLGRIVASQNAKQANNNAYSYTTYDNLGRITEAGELLLNVAVAIDESSGKLRFTGDNEIVDTNFTSGYPTNISAIQQEVTKTIYNTPVSYAASLFHTANGSGDQLIQTSRNRVTTIYYIDSIEEGTNIDRDFQNAIYYNYDIHGNVVELVQHNRAMSTDSDNILSGIKSVLYDYDLISGNVNMVTYQKGKPDQFIHKYNYDDDNRILSVSTSTDGMNWEEDANYHYYPHGPLARTVLGNNKVQGMDFSYTLQGWLKGVNSEELTPNSDMGQDGTTNSEVAKDAFGYSLGYYQGDYTPIGGSNSFGYTTTTATTGDPALLQSTNNLYNGNIKNMVTNLLNTSELVLGAQLNHYEYDQLNRIKSMKGYKPESGIGTTNYSSDYSYDNNGNLKTLSRKVGDNKIDNFNYEYNKETTGEAEGEITNNRLLTVQDTEGQKIDTDLLDQFAALGIEPDAFDQNNKNHHNYEYDEIGQLIRDKSEGLTIDWRVDGKVRRVTKDDGEIIAFNYDGLGNRISKTSGKEGSPLEETHYIRDAQGNVLAVYGEGEKIQKQGIEDDLTIGNVPSNITLVQAKQTITSTTIFENNQKLDFIAGQSITFKNGTHIPMGANNNSKLGEVANTSNDIDAGEDVVMGLRLKEHHIYGSSRLGIQESDILIDDAELATINDTITFINKVGDKRYELSNHLGNVLSVVTDRKLVGSVPKGNQVVVSSITELKPWKAGTVFDTSSEFIRLEGDVLILTYGGAIPNSDRNTLEKGKYKLSFSVKNNTDFEGSSIIYEESSSSGSTDEIFREEFAANSENVVSGTFEVSDASSNIQFTFFSLVDYDFEISNFKIERELEDGAPVEEVAFVPDVISYNDYYPFGMLLPNRHGSSDKYRYGFNGKEKDEELKGEGVHYDYGFRVYDPRLAKFLSIDPLADSYPWYTPYHFAGNNPITFIDLDGLEESLPKIKTNVLIFVETDEDILAEIERNSKSMKEWKVIYATNIIDANQQFQKYTGGEKVVENLVVRTHGGGGSLMLGEEEVLSDDETETEYEPIMVDGTDITNFNHPSGEGTKEKLINNNLWSEEKYESVEALIELGNGLIDDANACFSACDGGNDSRLGAKLATHLAQVNVFINLGRGGTSGQVTTKVITKNKKTGEVLSTKKETKTQLLVPGFLSTKKTREKGFILYPAGGGASKGVGEVILQDEKDKPLITPIKQ